MPDKTANWGVPGSGARYRTQDSDPTGGGNFVVAERLDSNGDPVDVLLEWDEVEEEWVYGGPVNLDGSDVTNVGAFDADSVNTDVLTAVADVVISPEDDIEQRFTEISNGDVVSIGGDHTLTDGLSLSNITRVCLDFRGASLTLDDSNSTYPSMLNITTQDDANLKNISILGGYWDMDRENNPDNGTPGTQFAIRVESHNATVSISGLSIQSAIDGGMAPRGTNTDFNISNIKIRDSGEEGIYPNGFGNVISLDTVRITGQLDNAIRVTGGSDKTRLSARNCYFDAADGASVLNMGNADGITGATFRDCEAYNVTNLFTCGNGTPSNCRWYGGKIIGDTSDVGQLFIHTGGGEFGPTSVEDATIEDVPVSFYGPDRIEGCDMAFTDAVDEPIRTPEDMILKDTDITLSVNDGSPLFVLRLTNGGLRVEGGVWECDGQLAMDDNFGSDDVTVNGLTIRNSARGIYLNDTGTGWRLTNNVVEGSGNGIEVVSGYDELVISQNDLTGSLGLVDNSGATIIAKSDNIGA